MFYHTSRRESEFVYHKSVLIEDDEKSWFFLTVEEKVLKLADITRSDTDQMDALFSSWLLSCEITKAIKIADKFVAIKELACSGKSGKSDQFVKARYYLQHEQWKDQNHETFSAWHNY